MIKSILEYLENTENRIPDKAAFSDGTDIFTFSQLGRKARTVGSALAHRGYRGVAVALLMKKHPRQLAASFGTVYAGCYYVSLDAEMPPRRMELIFETSAARVLICDRDNEDLARRLPFRGEILVYEDLLAEETDMAVLAQIRGEQLDTDPVYIVFTSGSTGIPKGVAACHRSVIDYAEHLCEALPFDEQTVFGNQTPLYFDAPLKEILPTIKLGAETVFIPKQLFMFPMKLCDFLNEQKINTVCWVVSALTMISSLGVLEKNPPKYLRMLAFGSEVFPKKQYELWRNKFPDIPFFNLYGPTEATGMSCYWPARELDENEPIPVGFPFSNTRITLLGETGQEIRKNDTENVGEIYISGTCVTLGYFNNPEKTAEAFVQNPLNHSYPETVYRTGDLGRWNSHGELVFVSRKDAQIKHMGHRIELGEIEAAAATQESVRRAVCVYDDNRKKIHLFYEGSIEPTALLVWLKEFLPKYMLPGSCHRMDSLPLTPNGKLDRRGLRETAEKM